VLQLQIPVIGGAAPDGTRHLKIDVIQWTMGQVTTGRHVVTMVGYRAADFIGAGVSFWSASE